MGDRAGDTTAVDAYVNAQLVRDNERLEDTIKLLRESLQEARQIRQDTIDPRIGHAAQEIQKYLPQWGLIATNLSYVASAVQVVNTNQSAGNASLNRIAAALEDQATATREQTEAMKEQTDRLDTLLAIADTVSEDAWKSRVQKQ